MLITLIDIIFFAVVTAQVVIAIIAAVSVRNLSKRFARPLGSKTTLVELLQKYSRIFSAINIKVDARINSPAQAVGDTLLVNRRTAYSTDLFATYYALYQIILLQPTYNMLRRAPWLQRGAFILEIALFAAGMRLYEPLKIVAIAIGGVLLITAFIYQSFLADVLNDTFDVSTDLLDLDEVEQARTKALVKDMQSKAFVYAVEPLIWLVKFVFPFGSTP